MSAGGGQRDGGVEQNVGAGAVEQTPSVAATLFGSALPLVEQFAALLVTDGVERGLIGPREPARVWTRHLLDGAALGQVLPHGVRVVDVGSGAGLPGIPLALARPDLRVDLLEPMLRRTTFLTEAVGALGLGDRVRVVRGRAEAPEIRQAVGDADWTCARAVAPLDRLASWCLPLLRPDGRLAALKGRSADDEITEHRVALERLGVSRIEVLRPAADLLDPAPTVVVLTKAAAPHRSPRRHRPLNPKPSGAKAQDRKSTHRRDGR